MKKSRFGVLLFSSISCSSSYATHAWFTPLELDILLKPAKIEALYEMVPDTQFLAYPLFGTTKGAEGGRDNQPPPDSEEFELLNPAANEEEPLVSLSFQHLQSSMAGQSLSPSRSDEITLEQLQQNYPHIYEMIRDIHDKKPFLSGHYDPSRQINGLPLFTLTHKVLKALDSAIKKLKSQDKYKPQKNTFGKEFFSLFTTLHINLLTSIADFSTLTTILSMYFEQPATMVQLIERVQNTAASLHHQGLLQVINQSQLVTHFIQQIASWSSSHLVATSFANGSPNLPLLIMAFTDHHFQNAVGLQVIAGQNFSESRTTVFQNRAQIYPQLISSISNYFDNFGFNEEQATNIANYLVHILRRNPALFYTMMTGESSPPAWITENRGADTQPLLQGLNTLAGVDPNTNTNILRLLSSPYLVQAASAWLAELANQPGISGDSHQTFLRFLISHLPQRINQETVIPWIVNGMSSLLLREDHPIQDDDIPVIITAIISTTREPIDTEINNAAQVLNYLLTHGGSVRFSGMPLKMKQREINDHLKKVSFPGT